MATDLNLFLAFGAGFLSFISPCSLPLYPAFVSYITGMTLDDLKSDTKRINKSGMLHTLFFLLGFSIIFMVLGYGTSFIGVFFKQNQEILRQVGAIFIVLFGLMIVGLFTPKFLMSEKRLQFKNRPSGYFGSCNHWTCVCGGLDAMCRTYHRINHLSGRYEPWYGYVVYACICTGLCNSFLRSIILHNPSWMDSEI